MLARLSRHVLSAVSLAALAACGGGGGGDSDATPAASVSIKGTVATGAAVSGTVTLKDARNVERNGVINADGSYTIDATGMQAPFLLRAVGTVGNKQIVLTAPVTASDFNGTVNITPLSDLIVANLGGQAAQAFFSAPDFSKLDKSAVDSALQDLKTKLAPVLEAAGLSNVDFLRQPFKADHSGLDGLLDVLEITVDAATKSATIVSKVTGDSVTDDLQTKGSADTTAMQVSSENKTRIEDTAKNPAKAQRLGELQATIDTLNSIFTFGITNAEKEQLKALCDTTRFKDSADQSCDAMVQAWADDTQIGNKRLSIVRLGAFDTTKPRAIDDSKTAAGDITDTNVGLLLKDNQSGELDTAIWFTKSNGKWLVAGDQRLADISIRGMAFRSGNINAQGQAVYGTPEVGVQFLIDKRSGISYAVVKGTGLPTDGLTLQSPTTIGQDYMGFSGNPTSNLYQGLTATPQATDTYEIRFYDSNNELLGTYQERMRSTAVPTTNSAAGKFANITQRPTQISCANGSVSLAWALPSGSINEYISASCRDSNGSGSSQANKDTVGLAGTSATLVMSGTVANATDATAMVEVRDASGVEYVTRLSVDFTSGSTTPAPDPNPAPEPAPEPDPTPAPTPAPVTGGYLQSTSRSLQTGTYTAAGNESTFTADTSPAVYQQYCSTAGMQAVAFNSAATVDALSGASALVGKSFTAAICQAGNPSEDLLVFNSNGTVTDTGGHGDDVIETIVRSSTDTAQVFSASGQTDSGGQTSFLKAYKVTLSGTEKYFIAEYGQTNGALVFFGWWQEVVVP